MISEAEVVKLYVHDQLGVPAIAKQFDTYPNKIRRMLLKAGVTLRDKSEAQRLALEAGRSTIPTEGRERTEEEKKAIGMSVSNFWEKNPEKLEKHAEKSRQAWYNRDESSREETHRLAKRALQVSSRQGSKIEAYLRNGLMDHSIVVEAHVKDLIEDEKLEVDIYLPEFKTAIEIDGPSHFRRVWDDERLVKQRQVDSVKNGILMSKGYNVIRIRYDYSNFSNARAEKILTELIDNLPPSNNYMEIEARKHVDKRKRNKKAKRRRTKS